ncbi:carbohydrate-binding wsc [Trichoderma arundinaceum]|uniref:Carbohydrate-binding wsc n=1 Tax=Trichoderma arundinaceum TaxID=490622 RepID=A0A395NWX6_TRIAR|nr:carbohydrate-binding wsc [Trichoderma arundinaceum]
MHLALIISLGAQLALGFYKNSSHPYPAPPVYKPPAHKQNVQPLVVGEFRLFGCVASTAAFPNFKKIGSSEIMNLDFCAASCPAKYFGTYNTIPTSDCYCGDELDLATCGKVADGLCDTPCPGDDCQTCGGLATAAGLFREKQLPLSVVLSLYVRFELENDHDRWRNHWHDNEWEHGNDHDWEHGKDWEYGKDYDWNHGHGDFTRTRPPHRTVTSTITRTTTSTITSCHLGLPHCSVGHKITKVVTATTELCPQPDWHKKKIVCFGGYCAPEEPCHGEHCKHHRIICNGDDCYPEECTEKDDWHRLVVCNGKDCHYHQCTGDECNAKVVCYDGKCAKETCYDKECHKKFVCKGTECGHEHCDGDDCYKHEVCNGFGVDCRPRPPCHGDGCPIPRPPAPRPEPPAPTHGDPGHKGSQPYPPPPVPVAPTTIHNLLHPTQPPVVAGSTKLGATVLTALLSFVIFL